MQATSREAASQTPFVPSPFPVVHINRSGASSVLLGRNNRPFDCNVFQESWLNSNPTVLTESATSAKTTALNCTEGILHPQRRTWSTKGSIYAVLPRLTHETINGLPARSKASQGKGLEEVRKVHESQITFTQNKSGIGIGQFLLYWDLGGFGVTVTYTEKSEGTEMITENAEGE